MKKLGRILHGNEQFLVARADWVPKIGIKVQDTSRKPIGRITDVFGPVNSPYLTIQPTRGLKADNIVKLHGSEIYIGRVRHYAGKKK